MIKIIDADEDVFVSKDELARYMDEYQRVYSFYSGTPPSFETFVKRKKEAMKEGAENVKNIQILIG